MFGQCSRILSDLYILKDDKALAEIYRDCLSLSKPYVRMALLDKKDAHYLKILDAISYCFMRYIYENVNKTAEEIVIMSNEDIYDTRIYEIERLKFLEILGFKYLIHDNSRVSGLFEHRLFYIDFNSDEVKTEPTHVYGSELIPEVYYEYALFSLDTVALGCIRGVHTGKGYKLIKNCMDNHGYAYSGKSLHDKIVEKCFAYLSDSRIWHTCMEVFSCTDSIRVSKDYRYTYISGKVVDLSYYEFKSLLHMASYTGIFSGISVFEFIVSSGISGIMIIDMESGFVFMNKESGGILNTERHLFLGKIVITNDKNVLRSFIL